MKIFTLISLLILSLTVEAGTGAIPSGPNIKLLKDNLRFKSTDTKIMSGDSDDPTVVAKSAEIGSLYIRGGSGELYQKTDSGSSTNWQKLLIGPVGLGTDECVARWDGTGSPTLQDSLFCISDLGAGSGLTSLAVDNLTLDGNTLSSTDANGNITLDPNGTGKVVINSDLDVLGVVTNISQTSLAVSNATITVNDGGNQASADSNDAGIIVEMSDATDAQIGYDSTTTSKWIAGEVGSLVEVATVSHAQTLTNKTIDADNNTITNIENADIKVGAAIDRSKLNSGSANHVIINDGSGVMSSEAQLANTRGGTGIDSSALTGVAKVSSGTWSVGDIDLTSEVTGILPNANGGTGLNTSAATNGQLLIGNGSGFALAGLTGTANQVSVTDGVGSITLATPQDIHTGASPTFAGATFSGLTASQFVVTDGSSALSTQAGIDLTTDITGILPVANGGTGIDGSSAANGSLLIGNGSGFTNSTITGTANQVDVTNSSGSITLSTPQNIHNAATPTFSDLTLSSLDADRVVYTGSSGNLDTKSTFQFNGATDTFTVNGIADLDNMRFDGNGITAQNVNGGIALGVNGTGSLQFTGPTQFSEQTTPSAAASNTHFLYFKSDEILYKQNDAGVESKVDTKSQDIFYQQDFDFSFTPTATGNNATYLGGGVLNGTFSFVSGASAISGDQSLQYQAGASSNNDYGEAFTIDLDPKQRGVFVKIKTWADMSNFSNDVTGVIYDKTNSRVLTTALDLFEANADRQAYEFVFFVPSNTTQISYGIHINNGATNTETLIIDDVELSTNPFFTSNLVERESFAFREYSQLGSTNTAIPYYATELENTTGGIISIENTTANGFSITALKDCIVNVTLNMYPSATIQYGWTLNSTALSSSIGSQPADVRRAFARNTSLLADSSSVNIKMSAGDVLRPHTDGSYSQSDSGNRSYITGTAIADVEHVITPAKSTLTDWESYTPTYAGLGAVTNNFAKWRRVGDSIEVEASVNSGSPTPQSAAISLPSGLTIDTNKISSGSQNALGVFAITETATNFTSPSVKEGYLFHDGSDTSNLFLSARSSADGVMQKDNGSYWFGSGDGAIIKFTVPIAEYSSDATFLAAVPVQQTAYLKDVKSSGTNGGTFTSGSWQTRDLNTIDGDSSFVSLSSNQFTLGAGKYEIEASGTAFQVDRNRLRLRNITDSTTDIVGQNVGQSGSLDATAVNALLVGTVSIKEPKTFELQHICDTTKAGIGFGEGNGSYGVDEIYAVVKITKIK